MNQFKLIKEAIAAVRDPNRNYTERTFLFLTFFSEIMGAVALVGDLVTGENLREVVVLGSTLVFVPLITLICLHFDRLILATRIIVLCLVLVMIPALFFFGGGLEGGGYLWIIFAFMYAGLVLNGKWRTCIFALIPILAFVCYYVAYRHSELIYPHSWRMFYQDSFISIVLVGILCYLMTWTQSRILSEQKERAEKEAEKAEELTRSQNRFFSSMSHEIRTPINSILGLNELILRDQEASDDIIRDATGIQGSGKMLLALINDILDFSKIEAGSMDIVPVDYRIGDMLSEIVNMLWLRAHDKGLGFEVSVDPEVPVVLYGDEVRIKQIIINLLNNAVKYTKEGKVELRIESRDRDSDTVELVISISDTGMGIKKEDIPYLFDAFKRVDEGKNRHIEGTGLGLSIVKQLIELMGGNITVSSVYGEGTTFTATIVQVVSDHSQVGELNIHNQQVVKRSNYESSFLAPEVRILIVDDNEMNLEVEKRLLEDTDMGIDTVLSGKAALDQCLKVHYDAIFMDHLMPGMDGVECLELLRNQAGGLNRTTPVIILTANAGSENRDLYNRAGFDGYLVKPVSGEAMEQMLIRHVSKEKIILRSVMMGDSEEIRASDGYADKQSVIITSTSMCDLPEYLVRKLHIPIIPFVIKTEDGIFKDGIHMDANELIRHMSSGKDATSAPPTEAEYTEFFAENLKKAHNIIHIAITTSMSKDFRNSSEAAKAFENVTIVNSECISSATGILILIGYKLIQQGLQAQEIVAELESVKERLKCSFVIDSTEYMARKGLVSDRLNKIARVFNLHPALRIREDKKGVGGFWIGRTRRAYRKYINKVLPPDTIPDSDLVFITYVDVPVDTLIWIEEEIRKHAYFEHVVFQQASAAISSNCGPGTFGILYFLKSNKSYNIGSFVDNLRISKRNTYGTEENEAQDQELPGESPADETPVEENLSPGTPEGYPEEEPEAAGSSEAAWYEKLEGIDGKTAIKNSGSEDAFKMVLKIFYDSIWDKYDELDRSYSAGDWKNYTIKIHALKSSSRLVGAMKLGDEAESLEMAGKEGDVSYIKEHHTATMERFLKYKEILEEVFPAEKEASDEGGDEGKPVADEFLMESIYEELADAAENMDCSRIDDALQEMSGYSIPEDEKERFKLVSEKAGMYDYEGLLDAIKNK